MDLRILRNYFDWPYLMTAAVYRMRPVRTEPIRWMIIAATILVIGIGGATYAVVGHFRDHAVQNGQRDLENTIVLLSQDIDDKLENGHRAQTELSDEIRSAGVSTEADFIKYVSTGSFYDNLLRKTHGFAVGNLSIVDVSGNLLNSSESSRPSAANIVNRDETRRLISGGGAEIDSVAATTEPFDGRQGLVFAHRFSTTDGHALGAVITSIAPAQIEKYFTSVSLPRDLSISIHRDDGALLVRYPPAPTEIAGMLSDGAKDNRPSGTISTTRPLRNSAMYVELTASLGTVFADWRMQTMFLICIAGAFVAIIASAVLLIVRHLSHQSAHFMSAVDNMTQGLLMFDADGRVVLCNERYRELYGVSTDIVKPGATLREVIAHRKELGSLVGDVDAFCARVVDELSTGKPFVIEMTDGRSIQVLDHAVKTGGWVSTHEDITERRKLDRRIRHLAHYDVLTDLPNRALFLDRLEAQMKRANRGEQFALLFIDLDEFKAVNDTLGHAVGDALLRAVASRLENCIGESDMAARLGGDEFAIIRSGVTGLGDVRELADTIYRAFAEPNHCAGRLLPINASIRIAIAPQDGLTTSQLLRNADMAMYRAKAEGRRTYRFFEPVVDQRVTIQPDMDPMDPDASMRFRSDQVDERHSKSAIDC